MANQNPEHEEVLEMLRNGALAAPFNTWAKEEQEKVFKHLDSCKPCVEFYDEFIEEPGNELLRSILTEAFARFDADKAKK